MPGRFTKGQTLTSGQYLHRKREPKVKARDLEKHSGI